MERISFQELPMGMFKKIRAIEHFIQTSSLDPQLLELIKLRVSQINGCAYCVDMHHKELKDMGETELRLSTLCVWEEMPCFSEQESVALHFAEVVTQLDGKSIPDEVFDALLPHFSKEEIGFVSLAITQINTWNRLMKVFQTVPGHYEVGQFSV